MGNIYAVAGNPVLHSRSPRMFNAAFRELSLDAVYTRISAASAEDAITIAREAGIAGLNITSPFKAEIIPFLDDVEADARTIGSVNTVVFNGGRTVGLTTDTRGVLGALEESSFDPAGKKAVVLGAGGAGRAAALALISGGAEVTLLNRSFETAQQAAAVLHCSAIPLKQMGFAIKGAHLLVSTVSSDERIVEPSLLTRKLTVLDANYARPTPLVRDARQAGCTIIDGRLWLLHQALPAFEHFTGTAAPARAMRKALMKKTWPLHSNIALIGLSGSGKTTVSRELARKTNMEIIDLDRRVEEQAHQSIAEVFAAEGEEAFRAMERIEVEKLWGVSHAVVACGGGTVLTKRNRQTIRSTTVPVWLWASPATIADRIGHTDDRPLLNGGDTTERIGKLLQERRMFYASTADLIISTEGKDPDKIAERIASEVDQSRNG